MEMLEGTFVGDVMAQPLWLVAWMVWMGVVNMASLLYWQHKQAKVVLGLFLAAGVTMGLLHAQFGYVRLLGLGHVLFWTPMVIYVAKQFGNLPEEGTMRLWAKVLLVTNCTSLVVDYIDVIRYFVEG